MKLARPPKRAAPETIVALIDVVFFLLVFFLLVGRMDATAPFDVTPPIAFEGTDMPGGGATLAVSADGQLALDGTERTRDGVIEMLGERLAADPGLRIRINAHAGAALNTVLPLAAEIEGMGAQDVVLFVTPGAP
ncbi:biopolymer transporter ExbD (plasmid) [Rhodobacteraceae bacterium SC52]|nr:biopolymer transporter ExbD [Rhodobacteraceae bacterium SC52]